MSSELSPIPFNFESHQIRAFDRDGEVWFVATDIALALGYRIAPDMTRNLEDDERDTHIVRTLSGDQEMTIISESGLYHAILKSRKPKAKPFRRWVTHEVLPSIRKTGHYQVTEPQRNLAQQDPDTEYFRTNLQALIRHIEVIGRYWKDDIGPAVSVLNPKLYGIYQGHLATAESLNKRLVNRL